MTSDLADYRENDEVVKGNGAGGAEDASQLISKDRRMPRHARARRADRQRDRIRVMRITKGTVVNGQIVVADEALDEGSSVTVLVTDESSFTLTEREESLLLDSIAEASRGELVDASDILRRLP